MKLTRAQIRALQNLDAQRTAAIARPAVRPDGSWDPGGFSNDVTIGGTFAPKATVVALARRGLVTTTQHSSGLQMACINDAGIAALAECLRLAMTLPA